jgi:diadenosine tetraphosphatase ApaH/serine/threonine PP2A family protein phosphatase
MRVAVISDVHGNARALEAVLAALDDDPPDAIWSLGDTVGYGARPNECCALVAERADVALAGNHDLVVAGVLGIEEFSHDAAAAARWSSERLEDSARAWLTGLVPHAEAEGLQLFHGSPRDPVWEYVLSEHVALAALDTTTAPAVLVGHSHVALALGWTGAAVEGGLTPAGTELALGDRRFILNPGSVGQPRDGDPRAAWLLLDTDTRVAAYRRVPYPIERTQEEIRDRGLPQALAGRLTHGV